MNFFLVSKIEYLYFKFLLLIVSLNYYIVIIKRLVGIIDIWEGYNFFYFLNVVF